MLDIAFFTDQQTTSLERQIELIKQLPNAHLMLRKIDGKALYELSYSEVKLAQQTVFSSKTQIQTIDPMIQEYRLDDNYAHEIALERFEKTAEYARALDVKTLYLRLPLFDDVILEFDRLQKVVSSYQQIINRHKLEIILIPTGSHKTNVYVYLFKNMKLKSFGMLFDSEFLLQNGEPLTLSYRLLKDYITQVSCIDIMKDGKHQPIGYGDAELIDLFKRLHRDEYKGSLVYENKIPIYEKKKRNIINRLFKQTTKIDPALERLKKDGQVTIEDVLENQYSVLRKVFK